MVILLLSGYTIIHVLLLNTSIDTYKYTLPFQFSIMLQHNYNAAQ